MKYGFWNLKNNGVVDYLYSFIVDNGIDVLILAEFSQFEVEILLERVGFRTISTAGCERIKILSYYDTFEMACQSSRYSIQIVNNDYILCCVHLPSNMFDGMNRRSIEIELMLKDLGDVCSKRCYSEIVFVGDFNENPYENNFLLANKFHALPSINDLNVEYRSIQNQSFRKYYNPMWNLLGDRNGAPGTYYHANGANAMDSFWHMYDQVFFSKGMFSRFNFDEFKIITETSNGPLYKENGIPNCLISDHFPIVFEIGDRK